MARPKRVERTINKHIKIPTAIHDRVEYHLQDPVTGKVPPGAYSRLVERLLRRWIQEIENDSS